MDRRYLFGVICTMSLNIRLNNDILLNPDMDAILAMLRSECISNEHAFWILTSVNACLKLLPVLCLNHRQNELSVIASSPAICRVESSC